MKIVSIAALACSAALLPAQAAETCRATSAATPPAVVELYTSEGCSSCPPADRFLSALKGRTDVLALAFHVNYWDQLGWPDRFASAEATARQYTLSRLAGSRNVYTPQVVADGRDTPDWRRWSPPRQPSTQAATGLAPALVLTREGDTVVATVTPSVATAPSAQFAGYWVVLEDGHHSRVAAGENAGETLRHDHVVRLYKPVAAWAAGQSQRFSLQVSRGVAEFPRRVAFVVTDAAGARPLQALALAC